MKKILTVLLIILGIGLFATEQAKDKLTFKSKEYFVRSGKEFSPLESYLKKTYSKSPFIDIAKCGYGVSTGLYRGFIGNWLVKNNKLYLTAITIGHTGKKLELSTMFENKVKRKRVFADWFTGYIILQTESHRQTGVKILEVENGIIVNKHKIDLRETHIREYYKSPFADIDTRKIEKIQNKYSQYYISEYRHNNLSDDNYNNLSVEIGKAYKVQKKNRDAEFTERVANADSLNSILEGTELISKYFEIDHEMINGYSHKYGYSCVQSSGTIIYPYYIDSFMWKNPIVEDIPQYNWKHLIEYIKEISKVLSNTVWLKELENKCYYSLLVELEGSKTKIDYQGSIPWKEAKLPGVPTYKLTLGYKGSRVADLYISKYNDISILVPKRVYNENVKQDFFSFFSNSIYFKDKYGNECYILDSQTVLADPAK